MNGPFLPGTDYIEPIHVDFTPENNKYEIEINEPNLHRYKFLRFFIRQDLHYFHGDSVLIYLQTTKRSDLLFVKPTPNQLYEFLEYRVRLSSDKFEGTSGCKLIFVYHGLAQAEMDIHGLQFGPLETDDVVILPTGISMAVMGAGLSSPIPGYNPVALGEVVNISLFPYNGARLKKVALIGNVYNENGVKYPSIIYDREFKVKYLTAFENIQIVAYFGGY